MRWTAGGDPPNTPCALSVVYVGRARRPQWMDCRPSPIRGGRLVVPKVVRALNVNVWGFAVSHRRSTHSRTGPVGLEPPPVRARAASCPQDVSDSKHGTVSSNPDTSQPVACYEGS